MKFAKYLNKSYKLSTRIRAFTCGTDVFANCFQDPDSAINQLPLLHEIRKACIRDVLPVA